MSEWRDYPLAGTGRPGTITLRATTLPGPRELLVALPPGYQRETARYPVAYLHDGQNLFDPATSHAGDWGLVDTLNAMASGGIQAIVAGIANRGRRRRYEYSPFRDIIHGGGGGARYLDFIVDTVKPWVDAQFRTQPEPDHTVIAGSSLGGLISLYALYTRNDVFGAAGVLSPALWVAGGAIFRFLEKQPALVRGRIHLDVGTAEGTDTLADVRRLRERLLGAGYLPGRTLSYREDPGAGHDEAAWGRRFREALPFLVGNQGVRELGS